MNITLIKLNKYGFILIYLILGVMILHKILNVPITHDETATTVHYSNFSVWEIIMYPDNWPNNHILNTLSVKFLKSLFHPTQFLVRIPNLIGFVVFSFAVFRILKTSLGLNSKLFLAGTFLFISNTYFLDFFGVSRGYGMASALATLSVSFLMEGFQNRKEKSIWLGFGFSFLAAYANFTLLVFWCAIVMITAFYFVLFSEESKSKFKKIGIIVFSVISYFVLIFNPLYKMQTTNQFIYWEKKNFYRSTMGSLIDHWKGESEFLRYFHNNVFSDAILIFLSLSIAFVLYQYFYNKKTYLNFNLAIAILLTTVFVNEMQVIILDSPHLNGRTALFYYPLFIIVFVNVLALFKEAKMTYLSNFLGLFFTLTSIIYLVFNFQTNKVREWYYDANNLEVIDYLKSKNENVTLKTNWIFHPSFHFYKYTGKTPFIYLYDYDKEIDGYSDAEYYYVLNTDTSKLSQNYIVEKKFSYERLLMRKLK